MERFVPSERALALAFAVLLALHAMALVLRHGFGLPYAHKAVFLFHMDYERNLPTLWSVTLFVLGAWGCARSARRGDGLAWGWSGFGVALLLAGADEGLALHERLMAPLAGRFEVSGLLFFAWIVPYGIAIAGGGLLLWRWRQRLDRTTRRRLSLGVALMVAGALGVEALGGAWVDWALDGDLARRGLVYDLLATLEESLEILGLSMVVTACLPGRRFGAGALRS